MSKYKYNALYALGWLVFTSLAFDSVTGWWSIVGIGIMIYWAIVAIYNDWKAAWEQKE